MVIAMVMTFGAVGVQRVKGLGVLSTSLPQQGELLPGEVIPPANSVLPAPNPQENKYLIGWWLHWNGPLSRVGEYASYGQNIFLLDGGYCNTGLLQTFKDYLAEAEKYNTKVIIYLRCQDRTTQGVSDADFITTINALKVYPALYAWSIADEPAHTTDTAARDRRHVRLVYSYNLLKQYDTEHPVIISFDFNSFNAGWMQPFVDVVDIIGIHHYPYYSNLPIGANVHSDELWSGVVALAQANGKSVIATGQGFGEGWTPFRNPTYEELLADTQSAFHNGIPIFLYWMDNASTDEMRARVNQVINDVSGSMISPTLTVTPTIEAAKDPKK